MNRRELLQRLSAIPFVSMLAPLLHGQSKEAAKPLKELRFANVEDFWAWAKRTQKPAKLAELEEWYKEWVEPKQQLPEAVAPDFLRLPVFPIQPKVGVDADGQVAWVTMTRHRAGWPEKSDKP